MGISSIDLMQTEQIEDLQNDVKELREKINLLVSDITDVDGEENDNGVVATRDGLTVKLNQAIADADNLNEIISAGYSTGYGGGSGGSNTGILKRLDELYDQLAHHEGTHTPYSYSGASGMNGTGSYEETHPPLSGTVVSYASRSHGIDETSQGSATRSNHISTATTVSAAAPVYVVESKAMITLKTVPEKRAKKLSRKIQGQITAEDRVHTNK
jgi:hypothetical protein